MVGASRLGQCPSNDQGTEGALFSQSFQFTLYSIPDHENEGSRSNTPEPPHPAAALDNEKVMYRNIDHDEMDSHESENAKTTKATSLRCQTKPTFDDDDDASSLHSTSMFTSPALALSSSSSSCKHRS